MDIHEVMRCYFPQLCHAVERMGADWMTADECAGDAVMAWDKAKPQIEDYQVWQWLYTTVRRKYLDRLRNNDPPEIVGLTVEKATSLQVTGAELEEENECEAEAIMAIAKKYGESYGDYIQAGLEYEFESDAIYNRFNKYNQQYQCRIRQLFRQSASAQLGLKDITKSLKVIKFLFGEASGPSMMLSLQELLRGARDQRGWANLAAMLEYLCFPEGERHLVWAKHEMLPNSQGILVWRIILSELKSIQIEYLVAWWAGRAHYEPLTV